MIDPNDFIFICIFSPYAEGAKKKKKKKVIKNINSIYNFINVGLHLFFETFFIFVF